METSTVMEVSSASLNMTVATGNTTSLNLHYVVWVFLLPVVVAVGVTGNILSIIVLLSKSFRHTTTGVYLPLTAAADIIYLLVGMTSRSVLFPSSAASSCRCELL